MAAVKAATLYAGPTEEPRLYSVEKLAEAGIGAGRPLPSVTTVLRVVNKPAFVPAALKAMGDFLLEQQGKPVTTELVAEAKKAWGARSRTAMDIGSRIHALCEAHGRGEEVDLFAEPAAVVNGFNAYLSWVGETGFVATSIEQVVANPAEGYAGTADAVGIVKDGTVVLVDWKSGKGGVVYNEYLLQWHAYAAALAITDGYIVSFDKETGECHHRVMRFDTLTYRAFLAARDLYEWMEGGK